MDENFNPNRGDDATFTGGLKSETFLENTAGDGTVCHGNREAVADVETSLLGVLCGMADGEVAVVRDLVAVRAGPNTYHPIKAIKGMASANDVILLSCLPKAPAAGEAAEVVRSALQRVLVRPASASSHHHAESPQRSGTAAAANEAAASAGPMPHLRSICPSAHAALVDARLLRAFPITRARAILAGLSPLPTNTFGLPTVVAGVADDMSGRCFIGQRAGALGFSAFSIRRELVESSDAALRIENLIADYRGAKGTQASARAVYDLCGGSHGDVLGGCMREGANAKPFARLATEWSYSSDTTRTLGSLPPPACSSLLLVGGTCPLSPSSVALRDDIDTVATAVFRISGATKPAKLDSANGPFGRIAGSDGVHTGDENASGVTEQTARWEADLEALLSGSENMAELAARTEFGRRRGGNETDSDRDSASRDGDTTGDQTQNGAVEMDTGEEGEQGERFRGDLDFSEWLWELMARASSTDKVRSALSQAFQAVGEGQIFPVIRRDNSTVVGRHLREGVAMAREARYRDTMSMDSAGAGVGFTANCFGGAGVKQNEDKAKAWRQRGSALIDNVDTLADLFVELGVHKVTLDLYHWFETRAGVLAADIERVLPANVSDVKFPSNVENEPGPLLETKTRDPRLDRLVTLATTLDLVALAQSCGAPWRQVRALANTGLAKLGANATTASAGGSRGSAKAPDSSNSGRSSKIFPVALPKPIPAGARSKLAHPVFWDLFLEPVALGLDGSAGGGASGVTETVSYTMATAALFQLKGTDEFPVFSVGAARAAQAALVGCPAGLISEVLSCVAGAESFAELKRRQQVLRAKGAAAGDDKIAVFVCEHRFMPW